MSDAPTPIARTLTAKQVATKLTEQGRPTNKHTVLSWAKHEGPEGKLAFEEGKVAGGVAKLFNFDEVLAYLKDRGLATPPDGGPAPLYTVPAAMPGDAAGEYRRQLRERLGVVAGKFVRPTGEVEFGAILAEVDAALQTVLANSPSSTNEAKVWASAFRQTFQELRGLVVEAHEDALRRKLVVPREDVAKMLTELAQAFKADLEAMYTDVPNGQALALAEAGASPESIEKTLGLAPGVVLAALSGGVRRSVESSLRRRVEAFRAAGGVA